MAAILRFAAVFALSIAHLDRATSTLAAAEEVEHSEPDKPLRREKRATPGIEAPYTIVADPIWKPAGRFVIWKKSGQTLERLESCAAAFVMNPYLIVTVAHCLTLQLAKGKWMDGRPREKVKLWEPNPNLSACKCVFYQGQNGEIVPEMEDRHPPELRWDVDCGSLANAFPKRYSDLLDKASGYPLDGSDELDYAFIPVKRRPKQPANKDFYELAMAEGHAGQEIQIFGYPGGHDNMWRGARVTKGTLLKKRAGDRWITFKPTNKLPADYNQGGFSGAPWAFKDPKSGMFMIVGVYSWDDSEHRSPEFNEAVRQKAVKVAKTIKQKME